MSARSTVRRTVLIILGAIVVLLAAAFVVVHTSVFAGYLRGKVIQIADEKLGSQVEIRSLSIPWDQLAVDVRGLTLRGREGATQSPLLQIERLRVDVDAGALFGGRLELSQVILDGPVLHINVDSQGQANFPSPKTSTPSATRSSSLPVDSLFHVAIHHMELNQGAIYYRNAKIPVSADLMDFGANVFFNHRLEEYYGRLGYKSGWIQAKSFEPLENSANLQFSATRSGIRCEPLSIALAGSHLSLYANVQDYFDPHISGRYAADLSTVEIGHVLRESSLPAGTVSASGTIRYQKVPGQSFLENVNLNGTLNSPGVSLHLRQLTAQLKALRAAYSLDGGVLKVADLRGDVLGGSLTVTSVQIALAGAASSRLNAALAGISLSQLNDAMPRGPYERIALVGRANVMAGLSWSGRFRDVVADAHATLHAPSGRQLTDGQVPLTGDVQIAYSEALDRTSLGRSELRIGQTTISAMGILSKHSNLTLALSTGDLHQLSELATKIETAARSSSSAPFDFPNISGSARFIGRANGSLRAPQIAGQLTAQDIQIESTQWRTIQVSLALSPSRAALSDGVLVLQPQGSIRVGGSVELRDWLLAPSSAVSLNATATELQISQLQSLLHKHYPVSGIVSAKVSVAGTRQEPTGQGWIHVVNASAWSQPLDSISVNFNGGSASLHAELKAASTAGTIGATLTYNSLARRYQVAVNTPGLNLADLELVSAKRLPLSGTAIFHGSGSGTIDNPEFSADLAVARLIFHGETISDFHSQLNLADRQLGYTANASLYGGKLNSQGTVALTGLYEATATLDVRSISVGTLAAQFLRNRQGAPEGHADLHGEVHGPLKAPSQLVVHAEVPVMAVSYENTRVSLVRPLVMNYRNGVATIEPSEVKGGGIDLSFQGTIPVKRSGAFRVDANGTVNLAAFQSMTPGFQSSGEIKVNLAAQGTLAQPNMKGDLSFDDVSFSTSSLPVDLSNMSGNIRVSGRRMEIVTLTGGVNGGSMKAQGSVDLGARPLFDLAVAARSVNVNYPSGVRARLDGDLRLNGSTEASALTGRVVIDYLGFTQQMDVATLASQFSSSGGISTPSPFEQHTKLNIAIQSASTLNLASSQLSIQGAANLNVVGTLADPVVLGRATLTGGELFFLGKRYDIKSGTIEFANPVRTMPSVDLYATTTVNQYNLSLHFLGPVDEMKTTFTSTPALPQADIINLLAFGQTTEQAATSSTPGTLGAESVLAQGVASQISGKIQNLAGISQLSISPVIAANGVQQNPGAQVSIQQRVSGRLLVTFTTNTAETQSTAVQVQYQLGGGLSISVLRDQNGGYGVDLHLHKSF